METLKIKGHSIHFTPAKDSFNRRALQYKNKLITTLGRLGVIRDDVELELDGYCGRDAKAMVTWYYAGHRMQYEHTKQKKFVDNLNIITQLIEKEVELVLSEKKPLEEFIAEFAEDEDVHDERKEAREFFGLEHDHKDIHEINKRYKEMAKTLHPDMPTGDVEKFKKLNHAHKILKRELA
ncbi:MAG: J domain-containing protein [Candidatus Diapherotrites archaeon]|nr:J domain-containing protein [Candidatus Diapherotrites archaeon]